MILDKVRRSCLGPPPGAWPRLRWRSPMMHSSLLHHLSERLGPSHEGALVLDVDFTVR